jgi:Tol biopolymer transport system component
MMGMRDNEKDGARQNLKAGHEKMGDEKVFYKFMEVPKIFLAIAIVIEVISCLSAASLTAGCSISTKNENYINYISFSPNGNKIIFDHKDGNGPYMINVIDFTTKEISAYQSPQNEQWSMGSYSPNGKKIVFSTIPRNGEQLDLNKMQLAIMDTDGNNIRKITRSDGPKMYPSFSRSGDKVIFVKAGTIRTSGNTPAADYDIFEVNINTGNETQLTWLHLFSLSRPSVFPDNESIIFSTYISGNDDIYIVKKGATSLPQPLIRNDPGFRDPLISYKDPFRDPVISNDGKQIYFSALALRPHGLGGYGPQMFQYSKDGRHRRVTDIFALWNIMSVALSTDGQHMAVVIGPGPIMNITLCSKVKDCSCNLKDNTGKIFCPRQIDFIINRLS